jgi:Pyruvate/2-oxoacid:ferredoxin oxidoreductase gamma subunit
VKVVKVPTAEIAMKVGNRRFQNMVALGSLASLTGVISPEAFKKAIQEAVPPKTLKQNLEAFEKGMDYVRS